MIIKSHEADKYVVAPPKGLMMALVYGPDTGLVQERAEKLLKTVTPDLTDTFNTADLSEAVESLVRSTLLLADITRPQPRPNAPQRPPARRGPPSRGKY